MASFPGPTHDAGDPPPTAAARRLNLAGAEEDAALAGSLYLSRDEVLRRRLRRVNQLAGYYRSQYWALMEDLRSRHRSYCWDHSRGPLAGGVAASDGGDYRAESRCAFPACKTKAMPLTRFCHAHILSDTKQKLYKPCVAPVGQITCAKPILRSLMPSLCNSHLQKHEKNVLRALKKGGLNIPLSNKAPQFSVIVAEYVNQIQSKRRAAGSTEPVVASSANGNGNV